MSSTSLQTVNVLFVCLGNICRSPTAEAVFRHQLERNQLQHAFKVDSCGTGDWHIGHSPDPRTMEAAQRRGFDLSNLRARQVCPADFDSFHYLLAMDNKNLDDLKAMRPQGFAGELDLFLRQAGIEALQEVPDPFYGGEEGFGTVLKLIEEACNELINKLVERHAINPRS